MKNRILAIVGVALLAAVSASAQYSQATRVKVPFSFQAGDQHMPAGMYLITQPSTDVIRLDGPSTVGVIFLTHQERARKAHDKACVTFHRVGERYFLKGIWSANERDGMELYPSRAEKETLEATIHPPNLTTVALNSEPER